MAPKLAPKLARVLLVVLALFLTAPVLTGPALTGPALTGTALAGTPLTQAGADALKPRVTEALGAMTDTLAASGITLKSEGDILVEPVDTYYAVTTPSLSMVMPGGITRTIGMIAINAIPTPDANIFKVALALPTPMNDVDASGATVGSLAFGQQNLNGLWNMEALAFTELNGVYGNIRMTDLSRDLDITIPKMTTTLKLTASKSTWSGPFDLTASNVIYKTKGTTYNISGLRIASTLKNVDLTARTNKASSQSTASNMIADYAMGYAHAADIDITANDITYASAANSGAIKNARITTSLTNLDTSTADGKFSASLTGMTNDDPSMARHAPSAMTAQGTATKLPLDKLLRAKNNQERKDALSAAGTGFSLSQLKVDAQAFGMNVTGTVMADAASALGMKGNLGVSARGLDELLRVMSGPNAAKLGLSNLPPSILATLAMIQMAGVQGTDDTGKPVRNFNVVMGPGSALKINGADMSALADSIRLLKTAPAQNTSGQ